MFIVLNTVTPNMLPFRLTHVLLSLQTALFWCFSIQLSTAVLGLPILISFLETLVFFPVSSGKVSFPLGSSTPIGSWVKSHRIVVFSFPIQVLYFLVLLCGRALLLQH